MRNKISIISIGFLFTFFSCCDDPEINDNALINLELDEIKQYVPYELLRENKKAVFINSNGSLKPLEIVMNTYIVDKLLEGEAYEAQQDKFKYIDPNNSTYYLGITVTTSYKEDTTVQEILHVFLLTTLNNGYFASINIENGTPSFGFFNPEKELNGIIFNDVFSDWQLEDQGFVYNGIYYTKDQGVVGFLDDQNELWSLDHFEKE